MFCGVPPTDSIRYEVKETLALRDGRLALLIEDEHQHGATKFVLYNPESKESSKEYIIGQPESRTKSNMAVLTQKQKIFISYGNELQLWDVDQKGAALLEKQTIHHNIKSMKSFPDENHLLLEHGDVPITILDITQAKWKKTSQILARDYSKYDNYESGPSLKLSPDGNRLLFELREEFTFLDLTDKKNPKVFSCPELIIDGVRAPRPYTFSADSKYLICHYEVKEDYKLKSNPDSKEPSNGFFRIWDITEPKIKAVYTVGTTLVYYSILAPQDPNDRYFITGNNYKRIALWDYSDLNKVSQLYNKKVDYNIYGLMFSQDKIIRADTRVNGHVYMPFSELTDRAARSAKEQPLIHELINQSSNKSISASLTKLIYEYFSHIQPLTPNPTLICPNITTLPMKKPEAPMHSTHNDSDDEVSDDDSAMNARPLVFNAGNISVVSEGNANLTLFSFQGHPSNPKRSLNSNNDEQSSEKRFKK